MSLVKELSRRNVFRVIAAFLVFGWLLLQVANALEESLGLPDWFDAMVVAMLVLGFPIAIVLSWVYELTPEGLKKSHEVDVNNSETQLTAKRLDYATIGGVVLVLATFFAGRFMPAADSQSKETATAQSETVVEEAATRPEVIDKSIAVLPFVAMSTSPDDEFFADGLSEELLNVLAKVPALKVAGRTSSFYYKGKNESLIDIASTLGVAHILEGSVRRSGSTLRVTAQLIEAEGGFHLWSETYDRQDGDVLEIQDSIAANVVSELQAQLLGAPTPVTASVSRNPEAESLYLIAQAKMSRRTLAEIRSARELYSQASALVPEEPRFLAGYAHATTILYWNHRGISTSEVLPEAAGAIDKALALGEPSADTLAIAGLVEELRVLVDGDSSAKLRALDYYERALGLEPTNILAMQWLASINLDLNNGQAAVDYFQRVVELDPLNELALTGLGNAYVAAGEVEKAKSHLIKMRALFTEQPMASRYLASVEMQLGRHDKATYWARAEYAGDGSPVAFVALLARLVHFGWQDEARALIASDSVDSEMDLSPMYEALWRSDYVSAAEESVALYEQLGYAYYADAAAWLYTVAGDYEKAREILKKQYPSLQGEVPEYLDYGDIRDALVLSYCEKQLGNDEESQRLAAMMLSHDFMADSALDTNAYTTRELRIAARELVGDRAGAIADAKKMLENNEVFTGTGFNIPMVELPLFKSLADVPEIQQISRNDQYRLAEQARKLASGETEKEIFEEFRRAGYSLEGDNTAQPEAP